MAQPHATRTYIPSEDGEALIWLWRNELGYLTGVVSEIDFMALVAARHRDRALDQPELAASHHAELAEDIEAAIREAADIRTRGIMRRAA